MWIETNDAEILLMLCKIGVLEKLSEKQFGPSTTLGKMHANWYKTANTYLHSTTPTPFHPLFLFITQTFPNLPVQKFKIWLQTFQYQNFNDWTWEKR